MFATIWLAGVAVGAFHMNDSGICDDMIAMMRADTDAAYAESGQFGLATNTGAIYRAGDWSYTCEENGVEVGALMEASS